MTTVKAQSGVATDTSDITMTSINSDGVVISKTNPFIDNTSAAPKERVNKVLVDIRKPPYSDRLIDTNPNKNENIRNKKIKGAGDLLDKDTADKLLNFAEKQKVKLHYNSALRTTGSTIVSAEGKVGSSHWTGHSIDLADIVPEGEGRSKTAEEKKDRLTKYGMIAENDPAYQLRWGSVLYPKMKDESMHFENASRLEMDAAAKAKEQAATLAAQQAYIDFHKNPANKDMVVTGVALDANNNPKIMAIPVSEYNAIKNGGSRQAINDEYARLDIAKPGTYKATGLEAAYRKISDGKLSGNNKYLSFIPERVNLRDLTPQASRDTVVNIDEMQLNRWNDMARLNRADMQANKYNSNKLAKNVFTDKHPFGLDNKHDGPPASIKLVLDKLHEDKLTPSAKALWKQLQESNVTYIDCFFLERMQVSSDERYQIAQSITDEYKIYFSGKRPSVAAIQGRLLDTNNQQWYYDFEYFYENFLRGSKAVENRVRAFLTVADRIYEILLLKFGVNSDSVFDNIKQFSIDAIILQTTYTGNYRSPLDRANSLNMNFETAPMSHVQTEYAPATQTIINDSAAINEMTANNAFRNTSARRNVAGLNDVSSLPALAPGQISRTISTEGIFSQNNALLTDKKTSRDSLYNSEYANHIQQHLLQKVPYKSIPASEVQKATKSSDPRNLDTFANEVDGVLGKASQDLAKINTGLLNNKYDSANLNLNSFKGLGWRDTIVKGVQAYNQGAATLQATAIADKTAQAFGMKPMQGSEYIQKAASTIKPLDVNKISAQISKSEVVISEVRAGINQSIPLIKQLQSTGNQLTSIFKSTAQNINNKARK